jgi:hypothetical protein
VPVFRPKEPATGVIVIAGPSSRLTLQRMLGFGPLLLAAADELAAAGPASPLLKAANVGTWGNVSEAPTRGRATDGAQSRLRQEDR